MAEENQEEVATEENIEAVAETETKERGSSENLRVLENIEVKLTVEVGSTIAKGEVVMVGERFGIRFTEVADPEERVQNL